MERPNDKTLWEFIARFAGWTKLNWYENVRSWRGARPEQPDGPDYYGIPRYLEDLTSWHAHVWPKIEEIGGDLPRLWGHRLAMLMQGPGPVYYGPTPPAVLNASALDRCKALYSAMDGILPGDNSQEIETDALVA